MTNIWLKWKGHIVIFLTIQLCAKNELRFLTNVIKKFVIIIYNWYMYEDDLALKKPTCVAIL